jgi:hypothetical protein
MNVHTVASVVPIHCYEYGVPWPAVVLNLYSREVERYC